MAEALRIAVANTADPDDPSAFSGSSAALLTGLRAIGVDGRGVGAELPVQAERLLLRSAVALRLRP
ncbi:MAG: hypothetical protein JWO90_2179, partial [Solirubrobacterales bacterium]|nr:hypothetical protein [Solirubrobacterales bacterium]